MQKHLFKRAHVHACVHYSTSDNSHVKENKLNAQWQRTGSRAEGTYTVEYYAVGKKNNGKKKTNELLPWGWPAWTWRDYTKWNKPKEERQILGDFTKM